MEIHAGGGEIGAGGIVIDGDGREGIEMEAQHLLRADPAGGGGGIARPHGEIVAEAEGGPGELVFFPENLHVHGQGGISREIERSLAAGDHEAARVAAVAAIGQHRAVHGRDIVHASERKPESSAVIERVGIFDPLAPEPGDDLVIGNELGSGAFENRLGIGHVVAVPVGKQHVIDLERVDVDLLGQRVRRDERIKKQARAGGFDKEAGMSEIGRFHIGHRIRLTETLGNHSRGKSLDPGGDRATFPIPRDPRTTMDLSDLRKNYLQGGLRRQDLDPDPLGQFTKWFNQAMEAGLVEPNAMTLATVDAGNRPSQRTVLLKFFDARGFVFFTNFESRKAAHIAGNPEVSLLFPWLALERQVIIQGRAEKIPATESLRYFLSRPRESQLGAWVSRQSSVISSRSLLEQKLAEIKRKFADGEVPLPSFWGGYRVVPLEMEFWQGGAGRLHDRFIYRRDGGAAPWTIDRLSP